MPYPFLTRRQRWALWLRATACRLFGHRWYPVPHGQGCSRCLLAEIDVDRVIASSAPLVPGKALYADALFRRYNILDRSKKRAND